MSERVPAMVSHRGVAGYKGPGVTTFDPTAQPADQVAGPAWQATDYVPPSGSSPAPASQAEMEAGTEAAIRSMSPLRVAQAVGALAPGGGALAETLTAGNDTGGEDIVHETTGTDAAQQTVRVRAENAAAELNIIVEVTDDTDGWEPTFSTQVTAPAGANGVHASQIFNTTALGDGDADTNMRASTIGTGQATISSGASAQGDDGTADALMFASLVGGAPTGQAASRLQVTSPAGFADMGIVALPASLFMRLVGLIAAPPDAGLGTSQFGFWLDASNGAPKLMIKAKTADGTVVEGEVALS